MIRCPKKFFGQTTKIRLTVSRFGVTIPDMNPMRKEDMVNFFHEFSKDKAPCAKNMEWQRNVLRCKKCGSVIAIRWVYDGRLRYYIFHGYENLKSKIELLPSTYVYVKPEDISGEISFEDFDTFISNIRTLNQMAKAEIENESEFEEENYDER